jgi:hypothetical protein
VVADCEDGSWARLVVTRDGADSVAALIAGAAGVV